MKNADGKKKQRSGVLCCAGGGCSCTDVVTYTLNMLGLVLVAISLYFWLPGVTEDVVHYSVNSTITVEYPQMVQGWVPDKYHAFEITALDVSRSLLWRENGLARLATVIGADRLVFVIVFFAVVIPVLKVLVLVLYFSLGFVGKSSADSMLCRALAYFAQRISKWAAVNSVFEALWVGALLKNPRNLAEHRYGFFGFTTYSIVSAIAFMLVFRQDDVDDAGPRSVRRMRNNVGGFMCRYMPRVMQVGIPIVLLVYFLYTLVLGLTTPVVHFWVTEYEIQNHLTMKIDNEVERLVNEIGLPGFVNNGYVRDYVKDHIHHDIKIDETVSVVDCTLTLFKSGHFYTVWGSIILAVGCLGCPVFCALASLLSAFFAVCGNIRWAGHFHWLQDKVFDIAFLDVLVVGIVVVVYISASEPNVKAEYLWSGFVLLVQAVASWYALSTYCSYLNTGHKNLQKSQERPNRSASSKANPELQDCESANPETQPFLQANPTSYL